MIEIKKRGEKLTRRLRAKRIPISRTQVINLDHNLVGARKIRRESPAYATGAAGPGARSAAVDGLGDGGVVAGAAVPGAGGAGDIAGAVLGEGGGGASGVVASGGGSGVEVRGAGTGGLGRRGRGGVGGVVAGRACSCACAGA